MARSCLSMQLSMSVCRYVQFWAEGVQLKGAEHPQLLLQAIDFCWDNSKRVGGAPATVAGFCATAFAFAYLFCALREALIVIAIIAIRIDYRIG